MIDRKPTREKERERKKMNVKPMQINIRNVSKSEKLRKESLLLFAIIIYSYLV